MARPSRAKSTRSSRAWARASGFRRRNRGAITWSYSPASRSAKTLNMRRCRGPMPCAANSAASRAITNACSSNTTRSPLPAAGASMPYSSRSASWASVRPAALASSLRVRLAPDGSSARSSVVPSSRSSICASNRAGARATAGLAPFEEDVFALRDPAPGRGFDGARAASVGALVVRGFGARVRLGFASLDAPELSAPASDPGVANSAAVGSMSGGSASGPAASRRALMTFNGRKFSFCCARIQDNRATSLSRNFR